MSFDGQERSYPLYPKNSTDKIAVGEIDLVFVQGAAAPFVHRGKTATAIVDKIKQHIKEAQANGSSSIDLTGCELIKFPVTISSTLPNLMNLNLGFNRLSAFPDIFSLKNLQTLDLNGNQISQLPQQISQLTNLKGKKKKNSNSDFFKKKFLSFEFGFFLKS